MALDKKNSNQAYLQGRLVALIVSVLGKENVKENQIKKACTEAVEFIPQLLAKATVLASDAQQKTIGEVVGKLTGFSNLSPEEQGTFWVGYYHQIAEI